jgi:glucose dehydrogenase
VSYNGDYTRRRFSNLAEITAANVGNLRAQWIFQLRETTGLEVTPVVVNGIMFVTSANDAFALDARTGRSIWHYARPVTQGLIDDASQHHNRGIAIWHAKVFLETDNAHLLCLDADYLGQPRKLLVEANRNGFLYVLDRTDGKFLAAVPFLQRLTWAKAIDSRDVPCARALNLPPKPRRSVQA